MFFCKPNKSRVVLSEVSKRLGDMSTGTFGVMLFCVGTDPGPHQLTRTLHVCVSEEAGEHTRMSWMKSCELQLHICRYREFLDMSWPLAFVPHVTCLVFIYWKTFRNETPDSGVDNQEPVSVS